LSFRLKSNSKIKIVAIFRWSQMMLLGFPCACLHFLVSLSLIIRNVLAYICQQTTLPSFIYCPVCNPISDSRPCTGTNTGTQNSRVDVEYTDQKHLRKYKDCPIVPTSTSWTNWCGKLNALPASDMQFFRVYKCNIKVICNSTSTSWTNWCGKLNALPISDMQSLQSLQMQHQSHLQFWTST
jgi:hypothetical protein